MSDDTEREAEFLATLGRALDDWQWVEGAAYDVFIHFMDGANKRLISVIFHHIQSFDSRIQLMHRCAYFILPDEPLKGRWGDLKKRMTKHVELRNQIVHFSHQVTHKKGRTEHRLGPSFMNATYAINDRWKDPDAHFDLRRLRRISHDFRRLATDLRTFRDDLRAIAK